MRYEYDQTFVVDSENEDQKPPKNYKINRKTKNMGVYSYLPNQLRIIPLKQKQQPSVRKVRGRQKPIIKQYINIEDIDTNYLESIGERKQTMVPEVPTVILVSSEENTDPTAREIRMLAFQFRKKFPNNNCITVIEQLHEQISKNPKCIDDYLSIHNQNCLNKELLNLFISENNVSTACQKIMGSMPKNTRDHQQYQLQAIQTVRLRLSILMRDAMLKFNSQAKRMLSAEQTAQTVLTRQKINRIIEAGSALGVECRVLLSKYYLTKEPTARQFDFLRRKLHDQLKPSFTK